MRAALFTFRSTFELKQICNFLKLLRHNKTSNSKAQCYVSENQ